VKSLDLLINLYFDSFVMYFLIKNKEELFI